MSQIKRANVNSIAGTTGFLADFTSVGWCRFTERSRIQASISMV
jgi:hypothetical protein